VRQVGKLGLIALTSVALLSAGCSHGASSTKSTSKKPATSTACSLLTGREAAKILGATSTKPVASGSGYCQYAGAGSTIVVELHPNPLPSCKDVQLCSDPTATHVTVHGTPANWVAAGSLPVPSGSPPSPQNNLLTFISDGHFVTLTLKGPAGTQAAGEQVMATILDRL
jgi:hypothetical protein